MSKNLVIVESPAKAKSIEKFLGPDFKVASSFGHISDLPSRELGIDVKGDFKPNYLVSQDKKEIVKNLMNLSKKAECVWLASDEDREGEAIAWHLAETLELDQAKTKRIVFSEITKTAILKAIENPREIDYNLVDAQQARRVLDRIVGYELSPVLWRKIRTGLSAGRVQSVSVRLIVERERDIEDFVTAGSFRIDAEFKTEDGKIIKAKLASNFETIAEAEQFLKNNIGATFKVDALEKNPGIKSPAAPFTTSTLQQEASRKLYFSVSKTMTIAQRLYEQGFITYMRTDSVNLSAEAKNAAAAQIETAFGSKYVKTRNYKGKSKGAQEAHEAIRPTNFAQLSISGDRDQSRLYDLIWKRAIASQMSDAKLERTNVKIAASTHNQLFGASGEIIVFDGFLKVYLESNDDEDSEQEGMLPPLSIGQPLSNQSISATERFTRPPYRYTEASLVKKLEELGIGRPSTYAPTISTIQNRGYVEKGNLEGVERMYTQLSLVSGQISAKKSKEIVNSDKGKLVPTDIGKIVTDFLVNHFEEILDYNFTANLEADFDKIAEGKKDWKHVTKNFYSSFHPQVDNVMENADRESGERILGEHPESGRQVSVRLGKFGPMVQIGTNEDEDKPLFASVPQDMQLSNITFEDALALFQLPKTLGEYEGKTVEVNNGRYGPYVKYGEEFVSLPKGVNPIDIELDFAASIIKEKNRADAPIAHYNELPVQKGKGRFGPFIKWNGMFINVNKKYDWDNLSEQDVVELIEDKLQKEQDKLIHNWADAGIRVEKARWGRHNLLKGKIKIELDKNFDVSSMTLEQAQAILEQKSAKTKKPKNTRPKKK